MTKQEFEKLVAEALDNLPQYFQEKMNNVEVLILPWPSPNELERAGVKPSHTLLGLYSGIPLTSRSHNYALVPPDTITLYQRPIEYTAKAPERIPELVRRTVIHEIAHHFGISDERLRELGAY
ncbi:MAG: metallopeptidase family protein [Anaerolineae bacterium]|nr:MAG: metallopeptidase family protein [Anaerolineae bacterium]